MKKSSQYWIDHLQLEPHVEGGYFKEVLKSQETTKDIHGEKRALYTSIYFLLEHNNPSNFHQLSADEVWYFHEGDSLVVHMITPAGYYEQIHLGNNIEQGELLQAVVPKGTIFGSTVKEDGDYALVSCMVSPGFQYEDFKLFQKDTLIEQYPQYAEIIQRLTH